jgi:hypothetical protein
MTEISRSPRLTLRVAPGWQPALPAAGDAPRASWLATLPNAASQNALSSSPRQHAAAASSRARLLGGCHRPNAKPKIPEAELAAGRQRLEIISVVSVEEVSVQKLREQLAATKSREVSAQAVLDYLRGVRGMDHSKCPREFALAYREYLDAWQRYPDRFNDPKADAASDEIEERWGDVLTTARRLKAID